MFAIFMLNNWTRQYTNPAEMHYCSVSVEDKQFEHIINRRQSHMCHLHGMNP